MFLFPFLLNENLLVLAINMISLISGGVVSFLDIAYYTRPTTYYEGAVRVAHFTLPASKLANLTS